MRHSPLLGAAVAAAAIAGCRTSGVPPSHLGFSLGDLATAKEFTARRVSSRDPSGGNDDGQWKRPIQPGETRTLAELEGPGAIHHIWITINASEPFHQEKIVLRMYWDGQPTPSVLCPIGEFFGTGHGEYTTFASAPLAIGSNKALNCFWVMPFNRSARIEVTNEGTQPVKAFYFYIDYRRYSRPIRDIVYFHAHYRQQWPCDGWKKPGDDQFQPKINDSRNVDGSGNYVMLDTGGRGHYVGTVLYIRQNDGQWWGEGDDMIFIDGDRKPTLYGTGSEDYFCGAWCFGPSFAYAYFGNPRTDYDPTYRGDWQKAPQHAKGARWTVYRFHVADPIPFRRSIRVTMEHGHNNCRSDDFSSVAYWYQTKRTDPLPPLPPVEERVPRAPEDGA